LARRVVAVVRAVVVESVVAVRAGIVTVRGRVDRDSSRSHRARGFRSARRGEVSRLVRRASRPPRRARSRGGFAGCRLQGERAVVLLSTSRLAWATASMAGREVLTATAPKNAKLREVIFSSAGFRQASGAGAKPFDPWRPAAAWRLTLPLTQHALLKPLAKRQRPRRNVQRHAALLFRPQLPRQARR
jgi:hypothetical protein